MAIEVRTIALDELPTLARAVAELQGLTEDEVARVFAEVEWFFFNNPAGDGVYAGAFEGDRLAGMCSIAPRPFLVDGARVIAAEVSRATTHPDFRGRGVFSALVNFLIEQARERSFAMLYATPNQNSGPIFLGRLGFSPLFHWHRAGRPLDWRRASIAPSHARRVPGASRMWDAAFPLRVPSDAQVSIEEDPVAAAALAPELGQGSCVVDRSPEYLRWRFARPNREYRHVFLRRGEDLLGWAAIAMVRVGARHRAHVGDYWTADPSPRAVRSLLGAVMEDARAHDATELYVASRPPAGLQLSVRAGFLSRPSVRPLIVLPIEMPLEAFGDWDYRDADADMF